MVEEDVARCGQAVTNYTLSSIGADGATVGIILLYRRISLSVVCARRLLTSHLPTHCCCLSVIAAATWYVCMSSGASNGREHWALSDPPASDASASWAQDSIACHAGSSRGWGVCAAADQAHSIFRSRWLHGGSTARCDARSLGLFTFSKVSKKSFRVVIYLSRM